MEESLGEKLRRQRHALGLSVRTVADKLATSQKFIIALEEGNYRELTAKIYARGFVEQMLSVLEVTNERAFLLSQFEREWEIFMAREKKFFSYETPSNLFRGFSVTPARIRAGFIISVLAILLSFLGTRIFDFLSTPSLIMSEPDDTEIKKNEPLLRVAGTGEKESRLTVNGRELRMDELGKFDDMIELRAGLNTLDFLLENRFGKQTKITKYVLVE